ncbi:MAG TPA: hypothetical protein VM736_11680 [Gemmatimonadales bacterium]|nr:hypothetical protein [Gemmatimonadales bacterium]
MVAPEIVIVPPDVPPDALLVLRIAALSDRIALDELEARHGLTLYALAYALTFDRNAADEAVDATFREVWRSAASYTNEMSVQRWLAGLTRRIVQDWLEAAADHVVPLPRRQAATVATRAVPAPVGTPRRRLRALAWMLGGAILEPALRYARSAVGAIRRPRLLPAGPSDRGLRGVVTPPWPPDQTRYAQALKAS